jgi:hypothetical protein
MFRKIFITSAVAFALFFGASAQRNEWQDPKVNAVIGCP